MVPVQTRRQRQANVPGGFVKRQQDLDISQALGPGHIHRLRAVPESARFELVFGPLIGLLEQKPAIVLAQKDPHEAASKSLPRIHEINAGGQQPGRHSAEKQRGPQVPQQSPAGREPAAVNTLYDRHMTQCPPLL